MTSGSIATLLDTPSASHSFAEDPRATALIPAQPPQPPAGMAQPPEPPRLAFHFSAGAVTSGESRPGHKPRNGKIAHLPKLEREMVNLMLRNNIPYRKIVGALGERGFTVTERNISNWKTRGGYNEWRAAQAQALELGTFQDNLTDFLRRHDAAELPEVGLQSAATSLSAILLRPDLMRELLADPEKYSKLIQLECRLARELQALQKDRDEVSKIVGGNPERCKREQQKEVEAVRDTHSSAKLGGSSNEPDIPHRNFIPKQLEPVHRLTYSPRPLFQGLAALLNPQPQAAPAAKPSTKS
jgi:hypothetical protein